MNHTMFADFLKRHNLEQVEFASWLGTDKGTVWRWTLPPENRHSRSVPLGIRAFCIAYDLMPEGLRAAVVERLRKEP